MSDFPLFLLQFHTPFSFHFTHLPLFSLHFCSIFTPFDSRFPSILRLGKEATETNAHSDMEMAQRLQNEAFGGSAPASAQSDADAALAAQLQAELNPGAGGAVAGGAGSAAVTSALVCKFTVTMEHVAKAGQVCKIDEFCIENDEFCNLK